MWKVKEQAVKARTKRWREVRTSRRKDERNIEREKKKRKREGRSLVGRYEQEIR